MGQPGKSRWLISLGGNAWAEWTQTLQDLKQLLRFTHSHRKFYKPVLTGEGVDWWVWATGVRHLGRDGALLPDTSENRGLIPESQTFQWLLYPHGAHSQACLELVPLEQRSVPELTHYSTCSQEPQFVIFDAPLVGCHPESGQIRI